MDSKILQFPNKEKRPVETHPTNLTDAKTIEDLKAEIDALRASQITLLLDMIIPKVHEIIFDAGIDITEDKYYDMSALLIETIKAMVGKKLNIDHVLHEFVDKLFDCKPTENEFIYNFDDVMLKKINAFIDAQK